MKKLKDLKKKTENEKKNLTNCMVLKTSANIS